MPLKEGGINIEKNIKLLLQSLAYKNATMEFIVFDDPASLHYMCKFSIHNLHICTT